MFTSFSVSLPHPPRVCALVAMPAHPHPHPHPHPHTHTHTQTHTNTYTHKHTHTQNTTQHTHTTNKTHTCDYLPYIYTYIGRHAVSRLVRTGVRFGRFEGLGLRICLKSPQLVVNAGDQRGKVRYTARRDRAPIHTVSCD